MAFTIEGAQDAPQTKGFMIEGAKDAPSSKAEPSFTQRVGEDYAKRASGDIGKKVASGEISAPSAALQTLEQGGGLVGDIAGEGVKSTVGAIPESIKQPIASKAKEMTGTAVNILAGKTFPGQKTAMAKTTEAKQSWDAFSKKHPEAAEDIKGLPNLANLIPASSLAGATGSAALSAGEKAAPLLKSTGEKLIKAGEKQSAERQAKGFIDLVSPKATKKVAEGNVGKTEQTGILRRNVPVPDKFTQDIANTVSQVPGVNPGRSHQYNYNKIAAENKAEAQKLSAVLKASNVNIPEGKINQAAIDVRNSLAKQTFIVGDAKKASDKMIKEAGNLIKKNGNTADGLLKSRQEFDSWAKGQIKGNPFSEMNTARNASLKAVRNSLNNLIADAVPDARVKESLTKQFHLYNALDNIKPKAASEGKNILTRGLATLEDKIPTKNQYLKHAAGLAGVGLAATHPATLAAAVPYVAYKGATSPITKRVIGKGLTGMGDILAPTK